MLAQQLIIQLSHYKRTIRSARTGDSFLLQTKKGKNKPLNGGEEEEKPFFFHERGDSPRAL